MSLNLIYSVREGWVGMRRAKAASAVTVGTVGLTLLLFTLFTVLTVNVQRVVDALKRKMSIEAFIDPVLGAEQIVRLEKDLKTVRGVDRVQFISKEQALEKFRKEFGEDPLSILGENPLPSSFQIVLKPDFRTSAEANRAVSEIWRIAGIEEVVFHGTLFRAIEQYSRIVILVDLCFLGVAFLVTLLLVANTMRLSLLAQSKTIQIMHLVGATRSFIRRPYLIQGMLEGGLGGGLAALATALVLQIIRIRFPLLFRGTWPLVLLPFAMGLILGFWGSRLGLKRFLHR